MKINFFKSFYPLQLTCLSLFVFLAGCGSEFSVLLDDNKYLPALLANTGITSTIYWSEQAGTIKKTSSKGTGETTLLTAAGTPLDIALYMPGLKIYWAEDTGTAFRINYANLDGTGVTNFVPDNSYLPDHGPSDIAIDTQAAIIYWNRYRAPPISHNDIWRVGLSSLNPMVDAVKWVNAINILLNPDSYTYSISINTSNRTIYFTADTYWDINTPVGAGQIGGMYVADLDFQNTYSNQFTASGLANPSIPLRDIADDGPGGHLFYATNTAAGVDIIMRSDLLFQNQSVFITANGFDIQKIGLDLRERKIYWTSRSNSSIYQASIDRAETGVRQFRQLSSIPTGIAISY